MKPSDDDLFKPLSAKAGRTEWSSGGREKVGGIKRVGDHNRVKAAVARKIKDARRAKGSSQ